MMITNNSMITDNMMITDNIKQNILIWLQRKYDWQAAKYKEQNTCMSNIMIKMTRSCDYEQHDDYEQYKAVYTCLYEDWLQQMHSL